MGLFQRGPAKKKKKKPVVAKFLPGKAKSKQASKEVDFRDITARINDKQLRIKHIEDEISPYLRDDYRRKENFSVGIYELTTIANKKLIIEQGEGNTIKIKEIEDSGKREDVHTMEFKKGANIPNIINALKEIREVNSDVEKLRDLKRSLSKKD